MSNKIVIIGLGETAEMAKEYFDQDSPFEVVAFAAEDKYLEELGFQVDMHFMGLPITAIGEMKRKYPASDYKLFVALGYDKLNHGRARIYNLVKSMGYDCVSYVSSRIFVGENVEIGENCFILENNVLQRNVKIGNNVTLWSGNHVGHGTVVGDHVFVSSQVAIAGHCKIGCFSFLGINSCIGDHVAVADNCWISAGVTLVHDTLPNEVYRMPKMKPERLSAEKVFGF